MSEADNATSKYLSKQYFCDHFHEEWRQCNGIANGCVQASVYSRSNGQGRRLWEDDNGTDPDGKGKGSYVNNQERSVLI